MKKETKNNILYSMIAFLSILPGLIFSFLPILFWLLFLSVIIAVCWAVGFWGYIIIGAIIISVIIMAIYVFGDN